MGKKFENIFTIRKIYEDTYCITDNAMGIVNMYLLVGAERALLIDSGYGNPRLLESIRTITDKEIVCVCTHGHVDHALGAYLFEKAYLHSADVSLYEAHCEKEMILRCGLEGIGSKPKKQLKLAGYRENVELLANIQRKSLLPLENVSEFDLGGRIIRWTLVSGHTAGSIALIDETNHIAFDGDAAGNGVWLFMPEALTLEGFLTSIVSYRNVLRHYGVTARYGGHAQTPLTAEHLDKLSRVCDYALRKQNEGKKVGFPMRFQVGKARLVTKGRTAAFIKP